MSDDEMKDLCPPTAGAPAAHAVAGFCPMGCGRTLFRARGGYVTCSLATCPAPTAVSDVLGDRETEHIVDLGENDFSIKHPLRERLGDALLRCDLHEYLTSLDGPPRVPGRYRSRQVEDGHWLFLDVAGTTS